jgi:mRNA-degrading endonuclease RelE of RelBE toxin-antitoxin system
MFHLALKGLAKGQGDIKDLEGPLSGYSRLRVANYRVILHYGAANEIECVFAERRSIVYEIFSETLREKLIKP